jgi:hypothetical protein
MTSSSFQKRLERPGPILALPRVSSPPVVMSLRRGHATFRDMLAHHRYGRPRAETVALP